VGVCSRCGRFLCDECRAASPQPVCLECVDKLEPRLRVRFAPFGFGRTLGGALSLLGGTWLRLFWVTLPFGIGAGVLSAYITPELNPQRLSEGLWAFYGALLIQAAYSMVVGLFGRLAGIAILVGHAEGRELTVDEAFGEAVRAWPRTVWATLGAYLRCVLLGLFCLLPGLWMAVLVSQVPVTAFLRTGGAPAEESEDLVRPRFWEVLGLLAVTYATILIPLAVINGVLGAAMKLAHQPRGIALVVGGLAGEVALAPALAVLVATCYGLHRLAGKPAPLKAWRSAPPEAPVSSGL